MDHGIYADDNLSTTLCPIKKHTKIVLVISSTKIN